MGKRQARNSMLNALGVCHQKGMARASQLLYTLFLSKQGRGKDRQEPMVHPGIGPIATVFRADRRTVAKGFENLVTIGVIQPLDKPFIAGSRFLFKPMTLSKDAALEIEKLSLIISGDAPAVPDEPETQTQAEPVVPEQNTAEAATSSVQMMERYILFGSQALFTDDLNALPRSRMNWTTVEGYTQETQHPEKWTPQQMAGFYWWIISHLRASQNQILTMPNWGRIIKTLKESRLTNRQLFDRINVLYSCFGTILLMTSNMTGTVLLDEGTLLNRIVIEKLASLEAMAPEHREVYHGQLLSRQQAQASQFGYSRA